MSAKVILRLKGGLGNQLFQYAAALGIAQRSGALLCLDTYTGFESDPFARRFRLNHFDVHADLLPEEECRRKMAASRIPRKLRSYRERCVMQVLGRAFDPFTYRLRPRRELVLEGYWQSERYFLHVTEQLRRDLRVVAPISSETVRLAERIRGEGGVAVHVRRLHGISAHGAKVEGRYGGPPAHVSLTEYYRRSVDHVRRCRGSASLFVFADSPQWARENMHFDCPTTFVSHNGPDRDYEDLYLMATCRDHVIANSSFSWWGAWLGQIPDKIVCAPRNFSPYQGMRPLSDVYPSSWTVV